MYSTYLSQTGSLIKPNLVSTSNGGAGFLQVQYYIYGFVVVMFNSTVVLIKFGRVWTKNATSVHSRF